MPLLLAPENKQLKIIKIIADDKIKKHLQNLGVMVNGEIEVVSRASGNVVISSKGVRLALDENLSKKILVV